MLVIDFETINNLNFNWEECYKWARFMMKNKNEMILPEKISMKEEDSKFCNIMPSIVKVHNKKIAGIKIVTRYPARTPSIEAKLLIFDWETGEYLALMDGTWITALRTGAVAVNCAEIFAKKDYSNIGIIGLGNVSRATMNILLAINKSKLNITLLRYKGQEANFYECFKERGHNFYFKDKYQDVITNQDIVFSAPTYFKNDICDDKVFRDGITLIPIHTRGFANCDLFFDKIYSDDAQHVKNFKYFNKFKQFYEICDVLNGVAPGRKSNNEKILCYNVGLSIYDIYFASKIYSIIKNEKISCKKIDLKQPTSKYWL